MLCRHRWKVIEVSPRVPYLKCVRCGSIVTSTPGRRVKDVGDALRKPRKRGGLLVRSGAFHLYALQELLAPPSETGSAP